MRRVDNIDVNEVIVSIIIVIIIIIIMERDRDRLEGGGGGKHTCQVNNFLRVFPSISSLIIIIVIL